MLILKFNSDACFKAFIERIVKLADKLIAEMYDDSTEDMKESEKKSIDTEYAQYAEGVIKAQIIYGALAIMRSYGTGSAMDKSNPALDKYMTSEYWNPARIGYEIVGRPYGEYTNILNEPKFSMGWDLDVNLEKKFKPIQPTDSIKKMEQRYISNQYTKVDSEFQRVAREFFETEMHKYFYNAEGGN
jgi:hypothetical protein